MKIIRSTIQQEAAKLLLDNVLLQLQSCNSKTFNMMLLIMDHYGIADSKALSQEIRSKLSTIKCENCEATNNAQGNVLL